MAVGMPYKLPNKFLRLDIMKERPMSRHRAHIPSPKRQATVLFHRTVDQIGAKRGGANGTKADAREECRNNGEKATLANAAKYDGVHSKGSKKKYLGIWIGIARYAQSKGEMLENISKETLSQWWEIQAVKTDQANTMAGKHSAVQKFGVAMCLMGHSGWVTLAREATDYDKKDYQEYLRNRAPKDYEAIVNSSKLKVKEKVITKIAIWGGLRLDEACKIYLVDKLPPGKVMATYLLPDNQLVWKAKGGQKMGGDKHPRYVPQELADEIRRFAVDDIFRSNERTLNRHLHLAATETGQTIDGGLHPFRYVFEQQDVLRTGSELKTAENMGHHRTCTTKRYRARD
jgi:hypothetical protein